MSMFDSITQTLADNRKSFVTDEFEELIQISVDKIFKEEYKQEVEQLHKFSLNLFLEGNIFDLLNIFKEKVGTIIKNVPYPRFNVAYFEKIIIFYKPNNSNFSDHEKNFFQKDKYNFYLSIFGDINDVYEAYQALNQFKIEDKSKVDWFYGTSNGVEKKSINLDHKYKVYDEFFPWIKNGVDEYYDRFLKSDSTVLFLIGDPGTGKAQPLDAMVKSPGGWISMEEVEVGTELVAPDGSITKVTGVYSQGVKDVYRVVFEDGRWTECCEEHLWNVYHKQWKHNNQKWRTVSLKDIKNYLENFSSYKNRLYVPLPYPEKKEDVDLPIDPYVLGAFIGDGGFTSVGNNIKFTSVDDFIIEEIRKNLPKDSDLSRISSSISFTLVKESKKKDGKSCSTVDHFNDLEMNNKLSYQKFIPKIYMEGSFRQKLWLIQGLMDTDGTVEKTGGITFVTTSSTLAVQLQELIRSIGGLCKISIKRPHYTYKEEYRQGRLAYILHIRYRNPKDLFRLPRKKERFSDLYQYEDLKLRIKSIGYVGKKQTQCIKVDHLDQLYITDEYIVTHNTSFLRELINRQNLKTALTYDEELMKEDALFINFLDNDYNLLIIEDADVVLRDRSEGNKAMNKLLNASDGLVKINKKIIFTANITDINEIDSALLRPGRCFDVLNFRKLSTTEACAAAVAAGVTEPDGPKTLAELFNDEQQIEQKSSFGFVMS